MASIPTIPANNRRRTNNAREASSRQSRRREDRPTDQPTDLPPLTGAYLPRRPRRSGKGYRQRTPPAAKHRGPGAAARPAGDTRPRRTAPGPGPRPGPRPQRRRRRPAPCPPFRGPAGAQPAAPARERHSAEERGRVAEEYRRSRPDAPRTDG